MGGRHAGTDTRDSQVGELPCVEDRDDGLETGDAQVVGLTCVVAMVEIIIAVRER